MEIHNEIRGGKNRMKKSCIVFLSLMLMLSISSLVFGGNDKADVGEVIKKSYFNGAFNDLDTESMKKGFHPDFAIFSANGKEINKYPIATWIEGIEKSKKDPNFDASRSKMDCKIVSIDVTGGCAAAKVEMFKDGKQIYTDYLSLLKFEDGWKIVAKVYHGHAR
jgi:hypothetical protein